MLKNFFTTYDIFIELLSRLSILQIQERLLVHRWTINRWISNKKVPDNYYNDINHLLGSKYPSRNSYRQKDQFYTNEKISKYCYNKTLSILNDLDIDTEDYIFVEPSAWCCNFYNVLPKEKRIWIDIEPKWEASNKLIKINFLDFNPGKSKKCIVIWNPPFGLRWNLALRFINHSYDFADIVAFILPPLFDSTWKWVPMTRVNPWYKLAHSEKLPLDSFCYPNWSIVKVATIFQIRTKINHSQNKRTRQKNKQNFC